MASELQNIARLLDLTLDQNQHRKAERELKQEQQRPQYSINLLKVVASEQFATKTRLSGALAFKNFIRLNYVDEDGNYKIPLDEVNLIKQELISLMISCPPTIQTQLGEAISTIADSDFWEKWQSLIPDLVSKLSPSGYKVNNGVLEVAHSIFVRWRPLFRSDQLFREIKHVLQYFVGPFLQLLQATDKNIEANRDNKTELKGYFDTLGLMIRIFYDLSCQDLPPEFEDTLSSICTLLLKYLEYTNPILVTDDDSEAGILETVKADICEALQLYVTKFDDDFAKYCQPFIRSVWNLVSVIGEETKYDLLASKCLQFLTAVASADSHAAIFSDEGTISEVVNKVILPNVALRESDIELLEDEPIEFIRRDLEGSDTDSRRRAATDFLRKLLEKFQSNVSKVVFQHIESNLTRGQSDWKAKDTAIYLFISIAAIGAVTAAQGVKTVNPFVDVVDFFQRHVANDLISTDGVETVAKIDAIKYLYTFRSQLNKPQWQGAFTPLIQNMASKNYVVYTYAAIAVERVLFLTSDTGERVFTRADIEPIAKDLLEHLFNLIEKESSAAKMQENEFLMRCIMRVLIVIQDGVLPILDQTLDHLIKITNVIMTNPSNPRFYYYHFEALGALIRFCAPTVGCQKLEDKLWDPFNKVFVDEVHEFMPYVFQALAALLEANRSGTLPTAYKNLLGPLLSPTLWETRGNVPGCTRLLSVVIPRAASHILANNQLDAILGIFQSLVSLKKMELFGLDILESITISFEPAVLDKYFTEIVRILCTKLDKQPSDSFRLRFVRFYHLVSARLEAGLGADYFIRHADIVNKSVYVPIYLQMILPGTEQLSRPVDRKLAVISYAKTLCDSRAFSERYAKGWTKTFEALLGLLQNPPRVVKGYGDEVINEADVDEIGFGSGYTPLNTCRTAPRDDFPEIDHVPHWLGQYITLADQRHNGAVSAFMTQRLDDSQRARLTKELQKAPA